MAAWPCSVYAFFTYVICMLVFPFAVLEETHRERRGRGDEHSDVLPGGVCHTYSDKSYTHTEYTV